MSAEKLVDRLSRLAVRKGLSNRTLGRRIGVGKSTINRWFNFEDIPSEGSSKKLTRFFKRVK